MKSILKLLSMAALFSTGASADREAEGDKCHGLAIASGKNYGPYQAGAIKAMLENPNEGKWDAISGVTEGALNAYILSLFAPDEQSQALDLLNNFWMTMGDRKVYDNYDFGMLEGFVFHDGIVKGDPMMDLIDEVFGNETVFPHDQKNSKKKLNIGISNVGNGTFVSFNDNFKTRDLLHVLKASISYPGVFSPYEAWNSTWFSGSAIWGVDVSAPILRCKAMGYQEKDIIIDAIIDSDTTIGSFDAAKSNAIQVGIRSLEVINYYTALDGVIKAQRAFPGVQFRNIVGPTDSWTSLDLDHQLRKFTSFVPISYSSIEVKAQMRRGYNDAKSVMNTNQGKVSHFTGEENYVKYRDLDQNSKMIEL